MKTVACIRVSGCSQDISRQRHEIVEYCNAHHIHVDEFIEINVSDRKVPLEKRINEFLKKVERGDTVVVLGLSHLGRSIVEVIRILKGLADKGVNIVAIKQALHLKTSNSDMDMQSKIMIAIFSLLADLERDIVSQNIKDALNARKASGVRLGRPRGRLGKSKLDVHKAEIEHLLSKKVSVSAIARIYGMSRAAVRNFINTRIKVEGCFKNS